MIFLILAYSAKVLFYSTLFYFDGDTLFTEVTKSLQILDPTGAGRYGSERIVFDEKKENVEIFYARTRNPDGKVVPVTKNAMNIVTHPDVEGYPEFSNIKFLDVSFLDLKKGSITEIKYRKKKVCQNPDLTKMIIFSSRIPVEKRIVTVRLPRDKEFHYSIKGNISAKKKGNTYTFELDSIPAVPEESNQPPLSAFTPSLFISTMKWEDVNGLIRTSFFEDNKIDIEIGDIEEPLEWIREEIKLIEIPDSLTGIETRSVNEVIKSGRGTIYERAKVLYSILKSREQNPSLILVFDRNKFIKETLLPVFEGILIKSDEFFLNPDDVKYSPEFLYEFSKKPAILLNEDTLKLYYLPSDPEAFNSIRQVIEINPLKKTFVATIEYSGLYGASGRDFYADNEDKIMEKIKGEFQSLGEISEFDFKDIDSFSLPLKLELKGKINPVFQGEFSIIELPRAGLSIGDYYPLNVEEKRKTPLLIPQNTNLSFTYITDLKDMSTFITPEKGEYADSLCSLEISFQKEDKKFILKKDISFKRGIISRDATEEFRFFLNRWNNPGQSIIILKD